ncbi:MAG: branched-chain amino acid ABC transporter [Actinomycetaceae bacterium]|nr:branched-chain amino acid ABC transporter [Actinomycetaceae bacterium]
MVDLHYMISVIAVVAVISYLLRLAPFVFLAKVRDSATISYLGKAMPAGVMLILVVFTLNDVTFARAESWLPPLVGVTTTALVHLKYRHVLLSLATGIGSFAATLVFF